MELNERSVTLRFETGTFSALFTGDIGFISEANILRRKTSLRSTLLKVPHHGSLYSTGPDFLDAVAPEIALISAGYGNSFSLPSAETIQQFAHKNIQVYRTDIDGTVTIKLGKKSQIPSIETFKRQIN